MTIPNVQFRNWARDDLPSMLWACFLIASAENVDSGLLLGARAMDAVATALDELYGNSAKDRAVHDGSLCAWERMPEPERNAVIDHLRQIGAACQRVPNVEAITLGGSRARGDHRPDSDWDFAMYYRGTIDLAPFEELDWPGRVYRPFEWGQVMYGGAVFDLDGRHFDIHYRNLDVVEHWTNEANNGRFEVHILGFHLAGIPTYMLTGELAISRTLVGELPRPNYPDALRRSAPAAWLARADGELGYAEYWAKSENPINCAEASLAPRCRLHMPGWRTAASGP